MQKIVPNQSGKEITHNEALTILDNIIHNCILAKNLSTPPEGAEDGNMYIVAENGIDDWAGKDGNIAIFDNGWRFLEPKDGFTFLIKNESCFYIYLNGSWQKIDSFISLHNLSNINFVNLSANDIIVYDGADFVNTNELILNKLSINGAGSMEINEENDLQLKAGNNTSFVVNKNTGEIDFKQNVTLNGVSIEDLSTANVATDDILAVATPLFQNTNSGNVGYVYHTTGSAPRTLPSGGVWFYIVIGYNNSTSGAFASANVTNCGIAAGGTSVGAAYGSSNYCNLMAVRIQ
ncbi:MAG: DUF2793 domain-containing protein [Rickettsiales bacterium]|nr:DUF2793 domain-containing protein [Rickettsiales bacterium]